MHQERRFCKTFISIVDDKPPHDIPIGAFVIFIWPDVPIDAMIYGYYPGAILRLTIEAEVAAVTYVFDGPVASGPFKEPLATVSTGWSARLCGYKSPSDWSPCETPNH